MRLALFTFLFFSEDSTGSSEAGNAEVAGCAFDSPAFLVVVLSCKVAVETPDTEVDGLSLISRVHVYLARE
jgi:hypothetical protein